MKQGQGMFGVLQNVLFTSRFMAMKFGIIGLIIATYIGYKNHETIGRCESNLFKKDIRVEQGYFPDGIGLGIENTINNLGHREVYLVHHESGKRVAIMYDLLPETKVMLEGLVNRAEIMNSDEAKTTLIRVNELERKLYENLQ